jgi:hypothetical protein
MIDFLAAVKETMGKIHKRLSSVYGNPAVDRNTAGRLAKRVRDGEVGTV